MGMNSYERALEFALSWEGGFVDHPLDRGGATNKGITQKTYTAFRDKKWGNIQKSERSVKFIEDSEVREIYKEEYWFKSHCDVLPEALSVCNFDSAVNHGPSRAIKFLQNSIGTTGDGHWGPNTEKAVTENSCKVGVLQKYLHARMEFYKNLVSNKPSQNVFFAGWTNRVNALQKEVLG